MPILEVLGLDGSEDQKQRLIWALKRAVASVEELAVTTRQVTPYVLSVTQEKSNKVIVVKVVGLFNKKKRTKEIRRKLVMRIYKEIWSFLIGNGFTATESIEVFIDSRIDPEGGEYYSEDPRSWTPKKMVNP